MNKIIKAVYITMVPGASILANAKADIWMMRNLDSDTYEDYLTFLDAFKYEHSN